jgi:AraC-like DNA-binding protein
MRRLPAHTVGVCGQSDGSKPLETTLALSEIAFSLGYSEVSAFNYAVRRWTGQSPGHHHRTTRGSFQLDHDEEV